MQNVYDCIQNAIATKHLFGFIISCLVAPLIVATYSAIETRAVREELIRGFLISALLFV